MPQRKLLGLSEEGRLVLKSADGTEETLENTVGICLLLLDHSGSMAEGQKLGAAVRGATAFAQDALAKGYLVGAISFATEALILVEPTETVETIERALESLSPTGTTAMHAGLDLAEPVLRQTSKERVIVLVTDGYPDSPDAARLQAQRLGSQGVRVIAIGTDDADWSLLRSLTTHDSLAETVVPSQLEAAITSASRLLPG